MAIFNSYVKLPEDIWKTKNMFQTTNQKNNHHAKSQSLSCAGHEIAGSTEALLAVKAQVEHVGQTLCHSQWEGVQDPDQGTRWG